jgi:hypothetical protein
MLISFDRVICYVLQFTLEKTCYLLTSSFLLPRLCLLLLPCVCGSIKLVDNVSREDVIPMDTSPEPSRLAQHLQRAGAHFVEKVMCTRITTTMMLFDMISATKFLLQPHHANLGLPLLTVYVWPQVNPSHCSQGLTPLLCGLNISHCHQLQWILIAPSWRVSLFLQRQTNCFQFCSPQLWESQASET